MLTLQGYGASVSDHVGLFPWPMEPPSAPHGAPPASPTSSSTGSADSYNGDDARRFLCQWNKTHDLYYTATREIGRLELYLEATQAALSAAEGETLATHAMLADADARVADKVFSSSMTFRPMTFLASILPSSACKL